MERAVGMVRLDDDHVKMLRAFIRECGVWVIARDTVAWENADGLISYVFMLLTLELMGKVVHVDMGKRPPGRSFYSHWLWACIRLLSGFA